MGLDETIQEIGDINSLNSTYVLKPGPISLDTWKANLKKKEK